MELYFPPKLRKLNHWKPLKMLLVLMKTKKKVALVRILRWTQQVYSITRCVTLTWSTISRWPKLPRGASPFHSLPWLLTTLFTLAAGGTGGRPKILGSIFSGATLISCRERVKFMTAFMTVVRHRHLIISAKIPRGNKILCPCPRTPDVWLYDID